MRERMLKIRRGKRSDFPAVAALFSGETAEMTKARVRSWRRLAADPAHDCYVAEHDGAIQGLILVSYIRRLQQYGWEAILDMAVSPSASHEIKIALLDFARVRARQRGCRRMVTFSIEADGDAPPVVECQERFDRAGHVFTCPVS